MNGREQGLDLDGGCGDATFTQCVEGEYGLEDIDECRKITVVAGFTIEEGADVLCNSRYLPSGDFNKMGLGARPLHDSFPKTSLGTAWRNHVYLTAITIYLQKSDDHESERMIEGRNSRRMKTRIDIMFLTENIEGILNRALEYTSVAWFSETETGNDGSIDLRDTWDYDDGVI